MRADDHAPEVTAPAEQRVAGAVRPPGIDVEPGRGDQIIVRRVSADADALPRDATQAPSRTGARDIEAQTPKLAAAAGALPEGASKPAAEPVPFAADPALPEAGAAETRTTAEHAARTEATVRHDTPRPVMQQVAEAARALRDGPVELTLHPEELGKVRMTMSAGADGTMTMNLHAERPETLELLRRHIGDLARELQGMGFSTLSFSFGQDRAQQRQDRPAATSPGEPSDGAVAAVPFSGPGLAARPPTASVSGGLDLRL